MNARLFAASLAALAPLAALLTLLAAAPSAAAPCAPSTTYFKTYSPTATTASITAATYDYTFTDVWTAHAVFDRTQGTMAFSASSGGFMNAIVTVNECFDITGVAPGTAVDAFLDWSLDGFSRDNCGGSGCGLRFLFTLTAGGGSVAADAGISGPSNLTRPLATTLSRPVHFVAGTPIAATFLMDYGSGPGAGSPSGEMTGFYRVRGLPPGVHAIASSGADVTPARATSWGRLKTLYR